MPAAAARSGDGQALATSSRASTRTSRSITSISRADRAPRAEFGAGEADGAVDRAIASTALRTDSRSGALPALGAFASSQALIPRGQTARHAFPALCWYVFCTSARTQHKTCMGAIVEILGTLLIVAGVILGIALGFGVAFGVIPLLDDYKKPVPRAARKGMGPAPRRGGPQRASRARRKTRVRAIKRLQPRLRRRASARAAGPEMMGYRMASRRSSVIV